MAQENNIPKFEDTQELAPPKFEDTVEHPSGPVGTNELQNTAYASALKGVEGATMGAIKPIAALAKTIYQGTEPIGNPSEDTFSNRFQKNRKEVQDYFDKQGQIAGIPGMAAEGIGGLMTGPALVEGVKGLYGGASAVKDSAYLQNLLDKAKGISPNKWGTFAKALGTGAAEGGAVGGVAGAINTRPEDDVLHSALQGAKIGAKFGGVTSGVGDLLSGSKFGEKLNRAYQKGTQGEFSFGSIASDKAQDANVAAAENATGNITGNDKLISDLYNAELKRAGDAGIKVQPNAALIQTSGDIAATPGMGRTVAQYHNDLINGKLSPQDAKNYELLVREMYNKSLNSALPNPDVTNSLKDLQTNLKQAYSATLPADRANELNKLYSTNKQVQETFLNNGIRNPKLQTISASDNFKAGLPAEINEKLMSEIIPNVMRENPAPSSQAISTLGKYSSHAKEAENELNQLLQQIKQKEANGPLANIYNNARIDYKVPETLKNIQNASSDMVTSGAANGPFRGEGQVGKNIKTAANVAQGNGIMDFLAAAPYGVANIAGKTARLGNNLNPLLSTASKNAAMANPTNSLTNAALMKMMQNHTTRKMLGVDTEGNEK
jgi:hypothetical protein